MSIAVAAAELVGENRYPIRRRPSARWVHGIACVTFVSALPLLLLGAEVTTKGVGMADPRPLVAPWQALGEFEGQSLGFKIEHGHRLAGWFVGMCAIALALALWVTEKRRSLRWFGVLALFAVVVQGVLGIFRVQLNAILGPSLAWIHGSFAPVVLSLLASVAWLTSPATWNFSDAEQARSTEARKAVSRWALISVTIVVYLQVVAGGMVRHQPTLLSARCHLVGAFVAALSAVWLVHRVNAVGSGGWLGRALLGLLTVQLLLGIEAWMSWMARFYIPLAPAREPLATHWIRSGHYLVGALLFAATVVLVVKNWSRQGCGQTSAEVRR
ncbi:MAG: COX15/CtaA family protein [Nitrospira sp.]|nr:COX15/CtaA family protein [Nitrospira sp.]